MKHIVKIISLLILSFSFIFCSKNNAVQYFGNTDISSKPTEHLATVIFDDSIFLKYKNNIEVFEGINENNDDLRVKHIIPQFSKILLDPGNYTFFINSKNKYIQSVENGGKKISRPRIYKLFLNGEPGKVYLFSQKNVSKEESFELQTVTE